MFVFQKTYKFDSHIFRFFYFYDFMKNKWTGNKVFLYDELIQRLVISTLPQLDFVIIIKEVNFLQSLLSILDLLLFLVVWKSDLYPVLVW